MNTNIIVRIRISKNRPPEQSESIRLISSTVKGITILSGIFGGLTFSIGNLLFLITPHRRGDMVVVVFQVRLYDLSVDV
ncbi:MAG: hypothetical protein PHE50_08400 [Dehalococcoidales bacterium]|nr:hypothetical protein [Dehalococcoidales bacterium]